MKLTPARGGEGRLVRLERKEKGSEGRDVHEHFDVKKHVPHVKAISESVQETAFATHAPEHFCVRKHVPDVKAI